MKNQDRKSQNHTTEEEVKGWDRRAKQNSRLRETGQTEQERGQDKDFNTQGVINCESTGEEQKGREDGHKD